LKNKNLLTRKRRVKVHIKNPFQQSQIFGISLDAPSFIWYNTNMKNYLLILIIFLAGCHCDNRTTTIKDISTPIRNSHPVSKWEFIAKYLKLTHPEWPETIKEITAELEYQEMLRF
jgi:hypothetical protein